MTKRFLSNFSKKLSSKFQGCKEKMSNWSCPFSMCFPRGGKKSNASCPSPSSCIHFEKKKFNVHLEQAMKKEFEPSLFSNENEAAAFSQITPKLASLQHFEYKSAAHVAILKEIGEYFKEKSMLPVE